MPPTNPLRISSRSGLRPATAFTTLHPGRGFTLVELLVVISIILTLAAMSLAVFSKMRARADNILAISNMRQIGVALSSYMSDNDHLPTFADVGVSPDISTANPYTQAYVLQPYLALAEPTSKVQHAEIFRAPGLKRDNMGGQKYWYNVICYALYSVDNIVSTKAYLPRGVMTDNEGQDVGPFGRVVANGTSVDGWKAAQLDAALAKFSADNGGRIATLSKVPAMLEINAEYPSIAGGWPWPVPRKTLREDHVNVLYFDWRVDSVHPRFFYTP
jgi:prepilin-type N-terminal cleavage/methylation domain-containing protein